MRSLISIGILIAGTIAFLLIYVFYGKRWGLQIGGICLTAAVFCRSAVTILAFSAVPDGDFDPKLPGTHRRKLVNILSGLGASVLLLLFLPAVMYNSAAVENPDQPDSGGCVRADADREVRHGPAEFVEFCRRAGV